MRTGAPLFENLPFRAEYENINDVDCQIRVKIFVGPTPRPRGHIRLFKMYSSVNESGIGTTGNKIKEILFEGTVWYSQITACAKRINFSVVVKYGLEYPSQIPQSV